MADRQLTRDARDQLAAVGRDRGDRATPGPAPARDGPAGRDQDSGTDAGRTSGGGSLGHAPPDEVNKAAPMRNNVPREEE